MLIDKKIKSQGSKDIDKIKQNLNSAVNNICSTIMADYNMQTLRVFAWVLHKIFKKLYENVVVDKETLKLL